MNLSADRIINVGPVSMTLPAFTTAITGLLAGMLLVFKGQAMIGFSIMLVLFMNAYTVNCTVIGHCNTWAWVLAISYAMVFGLHAFRGIELK